jgi:medium-chain acyl-[acyl-carrier-protein] hydrolase
VRPRAVAHAQLRLFCVPHAGGVPAAFRTWCDYLSGDIEVCPVQLPGRAGRFDEIPFDRMAPLVHALTRELVPHFDRPFAFFGHSMGALVAFEVARQLRRMGAGMPRHLFVSACRAPQVRDPRRRLHNLDDFELIAQLRRLNGIPSEVLEDHQLMNLIVPVVRADLAVSETYDYSAEPPLACPITAFGGLDDPKVLREEIEPWQQQTSSDFELHMLPGDHFFFQTAQERLLRTISSSITLRARLRGQPKASGQK